MSVQQQTPVNRYVGNGVTTVYATNYKALAKTDVGVSVDGIVKTVDVDFTVTGLNQDSGFSVTFVAAPANLATVVIYRATRAQRLTDYQNLGDFNTPVVNPDFDNPILMIQELKEQASRALTFPITDSDANIAGAALGSVDTRKGKYLFFNAITGAIEYALSLATTALTQAVIGLLLYPRTAAETAASITPTNYAYPAGHVYRYGTNTVPGTTNMAAALVSANTVAVASGLSIIIPETLHIGSTVTVTAPIVDSMAQLFSTTSLITISNNLPVRPEWFGSAQGNIRIAINALPSTGGTIQLEEKVYPPQGFSYGAGATAGVCISKDNVRIQGRKMPRLASDMRSLTGGSIIQGFFLAFANNFQTADFGVDSGITVVNNFYGGTPVDALLCTYPDDTTKAAAALRTFVRHHNVVGLCASPSAAVHAVIAGEGYDQVVTTGEVMGAYGVHGIVFKCTSVRAATLTAFCNGSEGVIIKADTQATARAGHVQIDKIYTRAQGPIGLTPYTTGTQSYGVLINPSGATVDLVEIGQIDTAGASIGIGNAFAGNFSSSSIKIGRAIVDATGVAGTTQGLQILGSATQIVLRWNIEHLEARNVSVGAQIIFSNGPALNQHCHIGHLHAVNAQVALDIGSSSYLSIDTVTTDNLSSAVYHITGTPKIAVGILFKDANTPAVYDSSGGGLVPALSGGWTQVAANDPFSVDLLGGRINLRGLVKPAASPNICTLPQWAWPGTNKRFVVQGYNGATQVAVPLLVSSAGLVAINEVAGGVANCTTWLSLSGVTYDSQA
jgi:hypothetical protein